MHWHIGYHWLNPFSGVNAKSNRDLPYKVLSIGSNLLISRPNQVVLRQVLLLRISISASKSN